MTQKDDLASDLLEGISKISAFVGMTPRRANYLAEKGLLPVFKNGAIWTGLKSVLRQHFADRASQALQAARDAQAGRDADA